MARRFLLLFCCVAAFAQAEAVRAADDLLAFEESLSGNTSEGYLRVAESIVGVYESGRALELHRKMVAISDMALYPRDVRRAQVRMNAALAFAGARQFEEAERLATEAVAVAGSQKDELTRQLEQIRKMKPAA